jgi:hypothetical protein
MFSSLKQNFYILTNGMSRARIKLFNDALIKNKAKITDDCELEKNKELKENLIILFDEITLTDWDSIEKIISKKKFFEIGLFEMVKIVKTSWLSDCLKRKSFIEFSGYEVLYSAEKRVSNEASTSKEIKKRTADNDLETLTVKSQKLNDKKTILNKDLDPDSDTDSFQSACSSVDESDDYLNETIKEIQGISSYTCSHSSAEQKFNYNKDIIDKLEELCSLYKNTQNNYRALGYQKAIASLKKHPKRITSLEVGSC